MIPCDGDSTKLAMRVGFSFVTKRVTVDVAICNGKSAGLLGSVACVNIVGFGLGDLGRPRQMCKTRGRRIA